MALVAPVLFAVLFGMIDMSRIFMADQDVATASREGAHYALTAAQYTDCAGIRTAATRLGSRSGVKTTDVTIQYDTGPGSSTLGSCPVSTSSLVTGTRIVITVSRTVTPLMPFIQPVTVHATAKRTIIKYP
jgi:Flp pilus assembly protein TadG